MKLIKLSDTHFVIVDNNSDAVAKGDTVLEKYGDGSFKIATATDLSIVVNKDSNFQYKITHSFGKFLEGVINKSLSDAENIVYGYNYHKLAQEACISHGIQTNFVVPYTLFIDGFRTGIDLVKDKMFSLEDIKKAIRYGFDVGFCSNSLNMKKMNLESEDSFIQSLLPKTEWNITLVDDEIVLSEL